MVMHYKSAGSPVDPTKIEIQIELPEPPPPMELR